MGDLLKYFVNDDPLKSASNLIETSRFEFNADGKEVPISVSLLLLTSIFLALSKTLYGEAGFTFVQHLITSVVIIFIGYIGVGCIMLMMGLAYPRINNILRCFFTCFIASLTASLLLVYFSESLMDVGILALQQVTASQQLIGRLVDLFPPLVFSGLGCFAVFWLKRDKSEYTRMGAKLRNVGVFSAYWVVTWVVLNYVAYDRGWFFDTVMKQIAKIKLV
jgi:hypothetical protein